jgi:hypothetical protein
MKADMSSGTASVLVALIGLFGMLSSKVLDDYLKERKREQAKK